MANQVIQHLGTETDLNLLCGNDSCPCVSTTVSCFQKPLLVNYERKRAKTFYSMIYGRCRKEPKNNMQES